MTVAPILYTLISVMQIGIQDVCIEGLSRSLTARDITFRSVWTEIVHHGILLVMGIPGNLRFPSPLHVDIALWGEDLLRDLLCRRVECVLNASSRY